MNLRLLYRLFLSLLFAIWASAAFGQLKSGLNGTPHVLFNGSLEIGDTLFYASRLASFQASNSNFQWYHSSDDTGTVKTAIAGAIDSFYVLKPSDFGKYFFLGLSPQSGPFSGQEIRSEIYGPVRDPKVFAAGTGITGPRVYQVINTDLSSAPWPFKLNTGSLGLLFPGLVSRFGNNQNVILSGYLIPNSGETFNFERDGEGFNYDFDYRYTLYVLDTNGFYQRGVTAEGVIKLQGDNEYQGTATEGKLTSLRFLNMKILESHIGAISTSSIIFKLNLTAQGFIAASNVVLDDIFYQTPIANRDTSNSYNVFELNSIEGVQFMDFFQDGHFKLISDINASKTRNWNQGKGFEPIEYVLYNSRQALFLDGQNYFIDSLYINRPNEDRVGLFGALPAGSQINNLGLFNIVITGNNAVGALDGSHESSDIIEVFAQGKLIGNQKVGGLIGEDISAGGKLEKVYTDVNIQSQSAAGQVIGEKQSNSALEFNQVYGIAGGNNVQGLIGNNFALTAVDAYFNQDSTANGTLGNARTTAQLQDRNTFVNWDFQSDWFTGNINHGMPVLRSLYSHRKPVIGIAVNQYPEACQANSKGSLSADILGGIAPYQILWSTGDTSTSITNVDTGSYSIRVIDAKNDTATFSIHLEQKDTQAPVIDSLPLQIQYLDANANASLNTSDIQSRISDACGLDSVSINGNTSFSCADIGKRPLPSSVYFNGSNSLIIPANAALDLGQATYSMWIKPDNYSFNAGFLAMRSGVARFSFHMNPGNNTIGLWNGFNYWALEVGGGIKPGEWHHIVILIDSTASGPALYVNGEFNGNFGINPTFTADLNDLSIGSSNAGHEFFRGEIGNVQIWDSLFSIDQIEAYQYNLDTNARALLAHYPLYKEQNLLQAFDYSGNGFHGTFNSIIGQDKFLDDTYLITVYAADAAGNSATSNLRLWIRDTIAPSIQSCPSDISVMADSNSCGAIVNYSLPQASDNCGIATTELISGYASGSLFPEGSSLVSYVFTDSTGNADTCSFTVQVADTSAIQFLSCSRDLVFDDYSHTCDFAYNFTVPRFDTACVTKRDLQISQSSLTTVFPFNAANNIGPEPTGIVRFFDLDQEGLQNNYHLKGITFGIGNVPDGSKYEVRIYRFNEITHGDSVFDFLSNENRIDLNRYHQSIEAVNHYTQNQSFGLLTVPVDLQLIPSDKIIVEILGPGVAGAFAGNAELHLQTVPGYWCRNDGYASISPANRLGIVPIIALEGEEYVNLKTVQYSGPESGDYFPFGQSEIGYYIQDGSGNRDSCTYTITLNDSSAATDFDISREIASSDSTCGAHYDWGQIENYFTECNLDTVIQLSGLPLDTIYPLGTTVNSFLIYDTYGNVSDTSYLRLTVRDLTIPNPSLLSDVQVYLDSNGIGSIDSWSLDSGSTDNCGMIDSIVLTDNVFTCRDIGSYFSEGATASYLSFDGINDSVTIDLDGVIDQLDTFSIQYYHRQDILNRPYPQLIGGVFSLRSGSEEILGYSFSSFINVLSSGSTVRGLAFVNNYMPINVWHKFTISYEKPFVKVYLDDNLIINSNYIIDSSKVSNLNLVLGKAGTNHASFNPMSNVDLDDFILYDSPAVGPISPDPSHILASYRFNQGAGDSLLFDQGPDAYHGQLHNFDLDSAWHNVSDTLLVYVQDEAGNRAPVNLPIQIVDTIAPSIQVLNASYYLDSSAQFIVDYNSIISSVWEACELDTVFWNADTLTCANLGLNEIQITASDIYGNSRTSIAQLTLLDSIAPAVYAKSIDLYLDASGQASVSASEVDSNSYDPNCSLDTLYLSQTEFTCSDLGTPTVYLIGMDNSGNKDSSLVTISVLDTVKPDVRTRDIQIYLDANGQASIVPADIDSGSTKICANLNLDISQNNFSCVDLGFKTVWLIADDGLGNRDSASAQVEILDSLAPQLQALNQILYLDNSGQANLTVNEVNDASTDNCAIQQLSLSKTQFNCDDLGIQDYYLIGSDASGNIDSLAFSVEVRDTIKPIADARNRLVYLGADGMVNLDPQSVDRASVSNCNVSYALSQSTFTCADEGLNLETFYITDLAGNQDSATFLVEVRDTISPVVIPRNITVQLGATGQVSVAASQVDSASYDNCSNQLFYSISKSSFNCNNLGLNTVSLTATDGQGNSTSAQAQVLVEDNILPLVRSRNLSLYLDANGMASITTSMVDNGSTDNCSIDSMALSKSNFDCSDLGQNTISFQAFDQSGNSNSTNAIITVIDTVAPVLNTQSINVYLDAHGQASISANDLDNGTSDNCAIQTLQISQTSFDCGDLGQLAIQFTASDASGNSRSQMLNVTVLDTLSPQVVGGTMTLNLDANGQASISAGDINSSSSDNCGISQWSLSQSHFDCTDLGTNTISLMGTDASGNSHSANWTIQIVDNSAPTVLAQNQILYLDAYGSASLSVAQVDAGSSDNCAIQNLSLSQSSFTCSDIGTNTLSLTADDASGNVSSTSFVATVLDTMAPVLSTQSINVYLDANGQATILASDLDNGTTDNCGIQDLQISQSSFDCSDLGSQTLTFTAVDVNGNQRSTLLGLTVLDTVSPTVPGGNFTLNLDVNGTASLAPADLNGNASDNCGVTSWSLSQTSFSCADVGSNSVSLTAIDASGNSQTTNYTILIQDVLAPVLNLQNITVYLNANGMRAVAASEVDNGSSDNCAIATRILDIDTFDCADLGQNLVTFTATDVNGNATSQNVIITVKDSISPSIVNLPANITAYTDANQCGTIVQWPAILGSDNCGSTTVSTSQTNGGLFAKGLTTVNVLVQDANGNSQSGSFSINVLDTIAPVISNVPQVYTVFPNAGSCDAGVNWNPPVATDNCGTANLTSNYAPGATLPVGTTTIVYTASDADGNSRSVSFDVTVTDAIAPQFSNVPADIVQANDAGQCGANVNWTAPNATDNCTVSTFSSSHNSGDFFAIGTTTVTYTASDAAGNQTSISFDITVEDQEKPMVSSVPANDTVGQCGAAYVYSLPVATDNCSTVNVQQIAGLPSGNVFPIGVTQNSFRISDAAGNDTVVGFTVVVIPQGQANLPDLLEICANAPAVDITEGQASINWSGPGIINSGTTFDPARAGTGRKTLTYTFVDDYGCSVSGSIIVTVLPVPSTPQIVQVASNTLSTTQTYSTYQWYRDGVAIPGAVNQNYSYTQSGHYQVIVGNISGCEVFGTGYAIGPINGGIGVEEFHWSDMQVYPNPNDGLFTIDFAGLTKEKMKVQVLSTDGKLVYESQQKLNAESQIRIDLRGLPAAVYYLRVSNGATRETRKLIIY
ncbi:HYR domain-containing protein [Croceimicrobium sp.]|uniref:HYR domain-containing protein n=1 Tax=Croceimicrobium sp. TaxID=2828340 RepID=UPI003BAB58EF